MRRGIKVGAFAATVAGLGISSTLVAYASWAVPSQVAIGQAVAGKMPQGVTPSAAIQDGRAVVSWSAQELRAGVRMQRYVVTAHSVDTTPRPDVARTVVAGGASTESAVFTSAELGGGKWKWAITPRFETWVGAEGRLSGKVTVPAPTAASVVADAVLTTTAPTVPAPAPTTVPDVPVPVATPPTAPTPAEVPPTSSPAAAPSTTPAGTSPAVESTTVLDHHVVPTSEGPTKGMPPTAVP
jgi:hypothetical protein